MYIDECAYKLTLFYTPRLNEMIGYHLGESITPDQLRGSFRDQVLNTIDPKAQRARMSYEVTTAAIPLVLFPGAKLVTIQYSKRQNLLGAIIVVKGSKLERLQRLNRFSFAEYDEEKWYSKSRDTIADGNKEYRWAFKLRNMQESLLHPDACRNRPLPSCEPPPKQNR